MLILQGVTYTHPDREVLFTDIHFSINRQDKIALIGHNGAGKSTLLKVMAGHLLPSAGQVKTDAKLYYLPQLLGQLNEETVAQALGVDKKLKALQDILRGQVTDANLALLDDDWTIEERCQEAFAWWELEGVELTQPMSTLSGGQKTKVLLAGIMVHQPDIVLLDEPSNHLDAHSRSRLYAYVQSTHHTLVVVSHDRTLLNLLDTVCELGRQGITVYGGNYDFYAEQKRLEQDALHQQLKSKEKELRKAKETERESLERQQKLDARGKKKQEKAGLPIISMNTFRNNAEKSTARIKGIHAEKTGGLAQELDELRAALPGMDKMKMNLDHSALHKGKVLITAKGLNAGYGDQLLWKQDLHFQINSGRRIVIQGPNGAGKTTLLKMILGQLPPRTGTLERAVVKAVYIDQDYSSINPVCSVYEQAQQYNTGALQEHEIKIRLNRFLFTKTDWDKPCEALSGGEKMRLLLCCLTIGNQAPDMIVLDEPTNNLDMQNIEILTAAINEYEGTLLVVSHDAYFLKQIDVEEAIVLQTG